MALRSYKEFQEAVGGGATVDYHPTAGARYMDDRNRDFNGVVDQHIDQFVQKLLQDLLNEYNPKLLPEQLEHIIQRFSEILKQRAGTEYQPHNDLRKIVNTLFRNGGKETPQANNTDPTANQRSPLANDIQALFNRRR